MSRRAGALAALAAGVTFTLGAAAAPLELSGYLQADYVHSQESQDQLADGTGAPLNLDRFLVRRARLRATADFLYLDCVVEADFNTVNGPAVAPRQLELAFKLADPKGAPARRLFLRVGAGLFRAPFGYEIYEQGDAERLFAERTLLAQALFPGELDLGLRLTGDLGWLRYTLAVQNGEPVGARPYGGRDPNRGKDLLARVGVRAALHEGLRLSAAASVAYGVGFHPGTLPTKDVLVWRDLNEDGLAQPEELQAIRGSGATPSESYARWGAGADLQLQADVPVLGLLTAFAEGALASNLDRGVRPADPVLLGRDQREVGGSVGLTQELTRWAELGLRVDVYEPSLDASRLEGGVLVRSKEQFLSFSAALAGRLQLEGQPWRGRLTLDYTARRDPLGRDAAGRPADLRNDVLTLRAQVEY